MTNKGSGAPRRWDLQMCPLSASTHKSLRGVRIRFHDSASVPVPSERTKDPLHELGGVRGEQMLSKAALTHLSASLSPYQPGNISHFQRSALA